MKAKNSDWVKWLKRLARQCEEEAAKAEERENSDAAIKETAKAEELKKIINILQGKKP